MLTTLLRKYERLEKRMGRITLVACDLDGTLLDNRNVVGSSILAAVERLRASGADVCLLSGRTYGFTRQYARALGSPYPIVALNGAVVFDPAGSVLARSTLPAAVGTTIHEIAAENEGTHAALFLSDSILSWIWPPVLPRYLAAWPEEQFHTPDVCAHFSDAVMYVVTGAYQTVQRISVALAKGFRGTLERSMYPSRSDEGQYYLEVRKRGVSKASALKTICGHTGIHRTQVAAIGDYHNDLDMCAWAAVSAVMRNGIDELRRHTDFVTLRTNDEEGAAEFLDMIAQARTARR